MSIRKTIITTIVALAVVAVVAPGVAQGVTIDELLAQIAQLQTQLLALQGGTTVPAGTGACAGVTFTRNLTVGSTGSDVKCLQQILNSNVSTKVATTGAGSPGNETSYFGQLTLAAVKIYQAAQGFTPANQVGPLTRAKLNAALGTVVVTPGQPLVIVPTGAGLSVQLAYDNPASGTVVSGTSPSMQGGADVAHFTFVNGDNAEVKVTTLNLKRTGVSDDAALANVYLYDGASRLTDGASVSSGVVNFNDSAGLFTVPAGGSKTIRVLIDLAAGKSGQTLGVSINAATSVTTNASSVKGTFPVSGNLFTAATATLAAVSFHTTTTPAEATVVPQNDYVIWQNVTTFSTRAVTLKRFALRQTGSALAADIQNYRLNIDGVNVGSAVAQPDANGYITFDLSASPLRIETGSRTIKVLADIIGGSSKTFIYSLRQTSDAAFTDTQVGVDIIPQKNSTTFAQLITGTMTIDTGTVTFTKTTDSPSGDIVLSAPSAVLAKYTLTAAGEPVKITDLYVGIVDSTTALVTYFRNGALYANGVQIGSTTDIAEGDTTTGTKFSLGSSLIVTPGSPVTLEIRSDIHETSGTTAVAAEDSIYATIIAGSSNAEGRVSKTTISAPAANTNGNTLTAKTGSLVLSKYTAYTTQTAVPPLTAYKLGHFTLTANTSEAVNISTIQANLNNVVSTYVTNLYVMFGTDKTTVKPTVSAASNVWSVNYSLAAGATKDLMVYGTISSSAGGTGTVAVYVAGTTASSATSVTAGTSASITDVVGQNIGFTTGSFTTALDGSTPLNQAVAGNQSVVAGKFKFTASNDSYTIKETRFTVAGNAATSAVIKSLTLKDGDTPLATVPYDSSSNLRFTITGLNVAVAANTTKLLTAEYNLDTPYTDGTTVTTGKVATLTMSYVKVANSQGTESLPAADKAANYTYVYKTVPTFTAGTITGQGTMLTSGSVTELYKFSVKADAKGPVALKQLKFAITITDGGTASAPTINTMSFFRVGTNITTSVAIVDAGGVSIEGTTTSINETNSSPIYVVFDTEETIPAGTTYTYTLKGTPSGFMGLAADADTVSTSIAQDTTPAGSAVGTNATYYFLDAASTSGIQTLSATLLSAGTGTAANVIWSDNSAQLHNYTYNGASSDWFNGYLIDSFPLSTIGIGYTN